MSDDLTVLGLDNVRRSYDEHYDTVMDVEQDPTGAFFAIQEQACRIEELEGILTDIRDAAAISEGAQWYAMMADKVLDKKK